MAHPMPSVDSPKGPPPDMTPLPLDANPVISKSPSSSNAPGKHAVKLGLPSDSANAIRLPDMFARLMASDPVVNPNYWKVRSKADAWFIRSDNGSLLLGSSISDHRGSSSLTINSQVS
jgi:hypothetical protein